MAHLPSLPEELIHEIFQLLEVGDKFRLSTTCKHYRAQLAPEIFKTIRLTNDEGIAQSALSAIEAHGQYTTRIEFTGRCEPNEDSLDEEGSDEEGPDEERTELSFPPAAATVLRGHLTPNLRTFGLKFDFDFDDGDWDEDHGEEWGGASIYAFSEAENEEIVREREETYKWRALMNETWRALAANVHVKELILDLIPKWTSAFRTEEYYQFLSRLESATFNILGLDNGAGWRTNTELGYIEFLCDLDDPFFHHMTGLKHLSIHASDPLGLEGMRHIPLALKPGDLPLLQSLKLKDCFVGPELVSFIRSHTQVLKSLDVNDCVSAVEHGLAENPISWARFFDEIYEAKPALTELIVGEGKVPLTHDEQFKPDYEFKDEPEDVQEIRRKLEADPKLRLFGYGRLDDKYGMFFRDEETNQDSFKNGNDQRAFDRLMGLVNENAAKAK